MTRPKILLYLHHVELGQRYPISEDVIIGRQHGHILFPKDERLSDQHCRIYQAPNGGLQIRDLGSESGTVVDGRLLSPEKSYPIRDGTLIAVGGQVFKCVEPNNRPVPRRKKKRRDKSGPDLTLMFALVLAVAAGVFAVQYQNFPMVVKVKTIAANFIKAYYAEPAPPPQEAPPPPPIASPFEIVYKDVESAYDQYNQIGKEVQAGSMTSKAMASEFRNSLIPKFQAAQAKLNVLKPNGETERRRIETNTKLVMVILKQITAMASFAETKNPKYSAVVESSIAEVQAANDEARKVNDHRVPASQAPKINE